MSKKIINNHMYNTETAKQLGYWSNGYNYYDLYFAEETLYQKDTREYFLVGCGGAMSSYSEFDENFRRETFNLSIIKTGAPCLGCSFAMYIAIHDYARTNNIPYIFHGRSRAQMFGKCLPQKDKDSLPFSELYGDNEEYIDFVKNYYQWNIIDRPYIGFYFYHDVSKKEMQDTIQKELNWKSTKIDGLEKKHFDCEYHEHANDMFRDKNGYDIDFYEQNYYLRMENWCGKI